MMWQRRWRHKGYYRPAPIIRQRPNHKPAPPLFFSGNPPPASGSFRQLVFRPEAVVVTTAKKVKVYRVVETSPDARAVAICTWVSSQHAVDTKA